MGFQTQSIAADLLIKTFYGIKLMPEKSGYLEDTYKLLRSYAVVILGVIPPDVHTVIVLGPQVLIIRFPDQALSHMQ